METFFKINDMTLADVDNCAVLEERIFAHAWSKKSIEDTLAAKENICMTVTGSDGSFVGYCIFMTSFDDADLCRIAISEKYRRNHIADNLLENALNKLKEKGIKRVLLEVRESNEPAISLYKKYGFEQIGIRKNYYSEPVENGLVFLLEIIPSITTVH